MFPSRRVPCGRPGWDTDQITLRLALLKEGIVYIADDVVHVRKVRNNYVGVAGFWIF
jgi:hypothetical protein